VRFLHRSGSLTSARELARYKLYFAGVQEVRWGKGGKEKEGDYIFFCMKKKKTIINLE
jgi:hypothetical protein